MIADGKEDKKNKSGSKSDTSLVVENRSGIDLDFNFLANIDKPYKLKNFHLKSFSKNELSSIYQSLNDEIVIKKKDKLAFTFEKIDYSIDELDFSYNHFVIMKIPINSGTHIKQAKTRNENL